MTFKKEVPAADELDYPYRAYGDEQRKNWLEELHQQGFVVVPECIDPELLAPVNMRADELFTEQARAAQTDPEQPTPTEAFITNLVGNGSEFANLLAQPNLIGMVTSVLGEDCLLSSASIRDVYNGCEEQLIHTDDLLYAGRDDWFKRPVTRQLSLVAAVALSDQIASRGTTILFPGSHMWEESPDTVEKPGDEAKSAEYNERMRQWASKHKGTDVTHAELKTGSVVIWLGATWHAGGAYTAADGNSRRIAIFNFCRGIFRQQENQMAVITHKQAAEMPQAVQRLLGYSMSDTGLGYSSGQDPALLLGEGAKALHEDNMARAAGRRGK